MDRFITDKIWRGVARHCLSFLPYLHYLAAASFTEMVAVYFSTNLEWKMEEIVLLLLQAD